jgi:hypothetical protein
MGAPSLREVQLWMAGQMLPGCATDGSSADAEPAPVALNPQHGVAGAERLAVYADGYLARTDDALAEVYEAVHHVLGRDLFARMAHDYVRAYPSREPNLTFVGRHLPAWLPARPIVAQLPFLPDLARLEWLVCTAFHAADAPPLRVEALAGLPLEDWARARLAFHPSVGQVDSAWPILDIWQARTQPREEIDIPLEGRPQRVVVFRHGVDVRGETLAEAPFKLLTALRGGATLDHACAEWSGWPGAGTSDPGAWLGRWAQTGLLVGCDLAPTA